SLVYDVQLQSGNSSNIIHDHTTMKVETRGQTSVIKQYVKEQVEAIVEGAAKMYHNDYNIEVVGEGLNCFCSKDLAETLHHVASDHPFIEKSYVESNDNAGSEDATHFMQEVQKNGGTATYCIFGTDLAAGHHNENFDINEDTLLPAVDILYQALLKINEDHS